LSGGLGGAIFKFTSKQFLIRKNTRTSNWPKGEKMSVKLVKSNISTKKKTSISSLISSGSISEAAQEANVSERTIYRWMEEPVFRAALSKAESNVIDSSFRQLISDLGTNLTIMRDIRNDQTISSSIRLRAAIALDNTFLRWKEIRDVEQRLTTLEVHFDKQEDK
jgi:hypothetical protein